MDPVDAKPGTTSRLMAFSMVILLLLTGCRDHDDSESTSPDSSQRITVFAAASTVDAISLLASEFEREHGLRVRASFAASSTLARQIEAGARADLFISANPEWMDYLIERGYLESEARVDLLSNTLVLIAPRQAPFGFDLEDRGQSLADAFSGRLAIGDPEHVPAGMYAREALRHLGWWNDLSDRIVSSIDVRSVLAFVERGEVDAGIVYGSDARASSRVAVVSGFPAESHTPIRFPVSCAPGVDESVHEFLAFLQSPRASEVFRDSGFIPFFN